MPNKFSSFSPSGRKELLEKLTKSDFMIEDIKNRVTARQTELQSKIREVEDSLIANETQLRMTQSSLKRLTEERDGAIMPDFDELIKKSDLYQADILEIINKATVDIDNLEKEIENKSIELLNKTNEKAAKNSLELEAYNLKNNQLTKEHLELKFKCNTLETEIRKLKSIKDTCPTCGQKLPNVEKPSTELQEQELKTVQEQLDEILKNIASCNEKHRQYIIEINNEFDNDINKVKQEVNDLKAEITKLKSTINTQNNLLNAEKTKQNKLIYDRQNYDNY
jgi:DNA repair exonuclease SbcCD ATPase subunit